MINKRLNGKFRVITVLIIVIVIMSGVGILMDMRLKSLLQVYVEKQVTEQARALALLAAERFELEMSNLEDVAENIPVDVEADAEILDLVISNGENVTMGILCLDGTALVGRPLSFSDFS